MKLRKDRNRDKQKNKFRNDRNSQNQQNSTCNTSSLNTCQNSAKERNVQQYPTSNSPN